MPILIDVRGTETTKRGHDGQRLTLFGERYSILRPFLSLVGDWTMIVQLTSYIGLRDRVAVTRMDDPEMVFVVAVCSTEYF